MPGEVTLHPVVPADEPFLVSMFASTRTRELAMLAPDSAQAEDFIQMQFALQCRHYRSVFPEAAHSTIVIDGNRAGRLIIARLIDELRIVDIALLPEFRRSGVGTQIVQELMQEARLSGLPIRCHVAQDNEPGRLFWARHGFIPGVAEGAHIPLEWSCLT